LNYLPFYVIYIVAAAVALLSIEVGWRIGNYRRQHYELEGKAPISAAVGATLGLLAFLLAFTFSMAANRFDTRKQMVLQEANAIGTTYLRADFLPEQTRDEVRGLLREYVAHRAGGMASIYPQEGMEKTAGLLNQLWAISAGAANAHDSEATALYIESLNQMIDLDASRITALRNRIPQSIWFMLTIVTIFSLSSMGYQFGLTGIRSWPVTILLVIVFTTVITLIADLDRPQAGLIQVSQQPLLDLLNQIGPPAP
jgi:hypothetical protein